MGTDQTLAKPAEVNEGNFDKIMLAMDVVDTLRRQHVMVEQALSQKDRANSMVVRLREIYRSQGIDVSDDILRDGVAALEEDRFTYQPLKEGLFRTLALAYVKRSIWGKWVIGGFVAIFLVMAGYEFGIRRPAEQAIVAEQIALTETIPAQIKETFEQIQNIAVEEKAFELANEYKALAESAVAGGDIATARAALGNLSDLRTQLGYSFDIQIVSRPGEQSGVWRVPEANPNAANYYLVVEAIGVNGQVIPQKIKSEEDGNSKVVSTWAQRVPETTFDRVRRDKQDDGILQNYVLGSKDAGYVSFEYRLPTMDGAITAW